MRQIITLLLTFLVITAISQPFVPGYHKSLAGEVLQYHAPQPDATTSLLVRSEDEGRFIEWQSAAIPATKNTEHGTLLLLAGIDVNPDDPHSWKVFVNEREMFTISSPTDTLTKTLTWPGPEGSSLVFKVMEVDKYGDFMGYLYCKLPASMLKPGEAATFKVVGESASSRTWFMVFQYEALDKVSLTAEQAVVRGENGNSQVLRAEIVHYADPVEAKITVAGNKMKHTLAFGYNVVYLPVPQITQETTFGLQVKAGKEMLADETFRLLPVEPRTIYLLHHSHNDIGYTHVQPEVEKMQWQNLEDAIRLADSTKNYPEGSQFKWCTEVMWAVETWYDSASPGKRQAFTEAVKSGRIELNGLFANELISLCGPEELDRLLEAGRRISRECGSELTSAMITDIPGWSWALVPALAKSGVKYLSLGTNRGHRIGDIIEARGDKPFYWVSPSGEEKVLTWIHEEGYSLFHTGLAYSVIRKRLQENLVFGYLNTLVENKYPYEEVMLRYNIGSDNGPVDETLPQAVREWNEKYITPHIVISTVDEAFSLFEQRHGSELKAFSGDITCYWEDGAYSTARETAINRRNASRLTQAQSLWAMYNPSGYSANKVREAWRNVLLYDEHTWGSWNSISEPEAPFTLQQWEIKKSFALQADKQSKKLFYSAMISRVMGGAAADAVEVINSCSWKRNGLIILSSDTPGTGIILTDNKGKTIPTQLLADGNTAFIAEKIPPFGSRIFTITTQDQDQDQDQDQNQKSKIQSPNRQIAQSPNRPIVQSPNRQIVQSPNRPIETPRFKLSINPQTGAIASLIWKENGAELADTSTWSGLNELLYVEGRMPDNPLHAKFISMETLDEGPVANTYVVEAEIPGFCTLSTFIRIIDQMDMIEVINTINKKKIYTPEAIHFAFPFNLPGGVMRYDLAYGYCRPGVDQLPGSNRNFLAMEHWLDISNDTYGVTVVCPDAPLFEVDKLSMDEIVYGWVDSLPPSQTFFSYLMNNYWETNYAAAQEGPVISSYIIMPHKGFNPAKAEKAAISYRQPLVARKGGGWQNEKPSLFKLKNYPLIVTSVKPLGHGNDFLLTVYNAGFKDEIPDWDTPFKSIYNSDADGLIEKAILKDEIIPPGGIRHIKVTL